MQVHYFPFDTITLALAHTSHDFLLCRIVFLNVKSRNGLFIRPHISRIQYLDQESRQPTADIGVFVLTLFPVLERYLIIVDVGDKAFMLTKHLVVFSR